MTTSMTPTPTIALHIIAKDEVELLRNIIHKYEKYFDEIVIAVDHNYEIKTWEKNHPDLNILHYKKDTEEHQWGRIKFDRKRNFVVDNTKSDYYFRLDTDDEIVNPESIREVLNGCHARGSKIVYCTYNYSRDEFGNPMVHQRETIVRNDKSSRWNKHIHENLLPVKEQGFKVEKSDRITIHHNIDHEHSVKSMERNFKYLMEEYKTDKDKTDPRTIVYIAKSLMGMGKFKEARFFFEKHISLSGWDDDRFYSWCCLSDIFRLDKDYEQAIGAAQEALTERPSYPDGYLKMGDAYFDQSDWKKCIEWTLMGISKPIPETMMILNMADYNWKPLITLAFSYFQLSEFKTAKMFFDKAEEYAPTMDFIVKNKKLFNEAYEQMLFIDHFTWLTRYYEENAPEKIVDLLKSTPKSVSDNEIVIGLKKLYIPPKKWSDNSVIIYCGMVAEEWSPASTQGGIGGSEEAVINLSRELVKQGYEVTVYNECGDGEGIHDGVEYINVIKFNQRDKFNTIIGWRNNISMAVDAKNKLLWIHDMPNEKDLTPELVRQTDKIIVLSEYHKSLLPKHVPAEKVYVSTNGICEDDFFDIKGITRKKNRIIYASSYDRGLELILTDWHKIKKSVPDAEIHIYYGWNTYDHYLEQGLIPDKGAWKDKMCKLFEQKGVHEHGRIGHKELLKEYAKSQYLAYPCTYAGEINCIALTKAIACGVYPITNDFAVMKERNTVGTSAPNDQFTSTLINLLLTPPKYAPTTQTLDSYIHRNSWSAVAKDWAKNLLYIPYNYELKRREFFVIDNVHMGESVVDIGCNEGHIFKNTPYFDNVTHVDLDDFGLPRYVKADAQSLPFPDKSFDVAILAEIMEHIPDPVKALKEARRVARRVVITVPNEHEWCDDFKPMTTIGQLMKETGKTQKEIALEQEQYRERCKSIDKEYDLSHLWHIRWYTPETLESDIKASGCTRYTITKLRHEGWSHIGAVCE